MDTRNILHKDVREHPRVSVRLLPHSLFASAAPLFALANGPDRFDALVPSTEAKKKKRSKKATTHAAHKWKRRKNTFTYLKKIKTKTKTTENPS